MSQKNPVEGYFQSKEVAKSDRKQKELDLWSHWKTNGMQAAHLEPLLKLYEPVLAQKMRTWRAPRVPESAFKLALQENLVKAFKSYDPTRGAALNTHVENGLQKTIRYNAKNQNLAYIPEGQIEKIAPIKMAIDQLTEEYGRAPTNQEIADHVNERSRRGSITAARVDTIRKAQRADIAGSTFESDPVPKPSSYEEQQLEVAANILPTLFPGKPELHTLFNHIYGMNDHEKITSTSALAKKMGKNMSQISRMKTVLGNTLIEHMGLERKEED